jgi:phospholipase C
VRPVVQLRPRADLAESLYSVTGGSGGENANRQVPIYDLKAFVRHLDRDDVSWRWYSHDPGTLRAIDSRYRLFHER